MKTGLLAVKCIRGRDIKAGAGIFGKADPFVMLFVGKQVVKYILLITNSYNTFILILSILILFLILLLGIQD